MQTLINKVRTEMSLLDTNPQFMNNASLMSIFIAAILDDINKNPLFIDKSDETLVRFISGKIELAHMIPTRKNENRIQLIIDAESVMDKYTKAMEAIKLSDIHTKEEEPVSSKYLVINGVKYDKELTLSYIKLEVETILFRGSFKAIVKYKSNCSEKFNTAEFTHKCIDYVMEQFTDEELIKVLITDSKAELHSVLTNLINKFANDFLDDNM